MSPTTIKLLFAKLRRSRRALAIPVTFLILFVSTLGLISVTYYFAVERVNAQSQSLQISTAKQNFLALDDDVMAVVWQPGAARAFNLADSGGELNIQPSNNTLAISVTDNNSINDTIYNETIGQVTYALPASESPDIGLYLKGDSRTITNQSGSVMTQLNIQSDITGPEIQLRYRPTVTCLAVGEQNNQTVNDVRIYVINMNSSETVALYGQLPLRISCQSTQVSTTTYSVSYDPGTLAITSIMNGSTGQVAIPISSTSYGAVINIQIVECNIQIERSLM